MSITRIQEGRTLTRLEALLAKLLKERLAKIDELHEIKWKQRAKRQWIIEGDRNTRYFHAIASHQKRTNSITVLQSHGAEFSQHSSKADILFHHFRALIGNQDSTQLTLDIDTIFAGSTLSQAEKDILIQPWTEDDIKQAVYSWKNSKSPGPDGYTGEFYNSFLHLLLPDLKQVFLRINADPNATLHPLNDSFIVLIPKKEAPATPHDFRPISLVNGIQKIYSKIMAAKLNPLLQKLLSPNQTGFLKKRNIIHGFYYAQQIVQSAHKQGAKVAVLKADIYKAFDTLSWTFLLHSLRARGFPQSWLQSIQNRILTGRSRIILNSVAGRSILLKRGVRQGDPISPYLFNLSLDFLSKWIQKLNSLNFLTPPLPNCATCLLYADDTLLFLKPTRTQLLKARLLFDIFGANSSLKINLQKSELSVTSSPLT